MKTMDSQKKGLIRATDLQQTSIFRLLLRFGCASASIISLYLTSINVFRTNTYKTTVLTENPCVGELPCQSIRNANEKVCLLRYHEAVKDEAKKYEENTYFLLTLAFSGDRLILVQPDIGRGVQML